MNITPRTSAPSTSNKYYIHVSKGGYNKCILIAGKSCLPNCVGYAYGRWMEMTGATSCKLPMCNAEDWFGKAKSLGLKTGSTPKVGAIMCWRKGKVGVSSDGAGHVAVVEAVYADGSVLLSESGYGSGSRMWTKTLKKGYARSGYVYQGCIYNEKVDNCTTSVTVTIKVGKEYTIKTSSGLNIRKTPNGKKLGAIPCGKKVKALDKSGNWIKIKYGKITGWICTKEGSTWYVK